MLTDTEFAKLLISWKNEFGEEFAPDRFGVPTDKNARIQMYRTLINTLIKKHQYEESDFEGKTYRMIMEASIGHNSSKKEGWRASATADWFQALNDFYPKEILEYVPETKEEVKVEVKKTEEAPEDLGPMALDQEEFEYLASKLSDSYDRKIILTMASSYLNKISKKQLTALNKIRMKASNAEKLKNIKPEEAEEIRPIVENFTSKPLDALFEEKQQRNLEILRNKMPPVNDPDDVEFLNLLESMRNE